jgi:cyclophilin family peptidyl-prolyl cis-trans isomerase
LLTALVALSWPLASRADIAVRMQTVLGDINITLFDAAAPLTVQNFLQYMEDRDWDGTFFHRSVPNFVIQGGGFIAIGDTFFVLDEDPPVPNEPGLSNLRGTIAMAKLSGDPDSATNQWFINLSDDNTFLDTTNGGFTVFGAVDADGSMAVVDAIAALPRWNLSTLHPAWNEMPLIDFPGFLPLLRQHVALVSRLARVEAGQCGDVNADLVVDDADPDYYQQWLADLVSISSTGLSQCSVIGAPDSCTVLDWVVMARDLSRRQPRMQDACAAQQSP